MEEGISAAISTFRMAAVFCEEYDGLVFNHNEVVVYKWIEEMEPELFARIQELVRKGKWHIMGGWYLQPDCNMQEENPLSGRWRQDGNISGKNSGNSRQPLLILTPSDTTGGWYSSW